MCNIYFPANFIFLLLPDLDLLHTAPYPVDLLLPLQTVSPDTEIIGFLLFQVFNDSFVFRNQLLLFALPLLRGAVTDLIPLHSGSLLPGSCHSALLLFEFQG